MNTTHARARLDDRSAADWARLYVGGRAYGEAFATRLGVPEEKVYSNIAEHGNTSSASIPIALDECIQSGKVKEGSLVLLTAFGGGVTWGATVLRF